MSTKSNKGGVREGAGRPNLEAERMKPVTVVLSLKHKEIARKIEPNSLSAGIRKALDKYLFTEQINIEDSKK